MVMLGDNLAATSEAVVYAERHLENLQTQNSELLTANNNKLVLWCLQQDVLGQQVPQSSKKSIIYCHCDQSSCHSIIFSRTTAYSLI